MKPLVSMQQGTAYVSPWSVRARVGMVLWGVAYRLLFRPTPKFFSPWRVMLLKLFGAKVSGVPFVAASARIKIPWNLTLEHRACLGPESEAYNLAPITLKARCTIAQQVYLCAGTHDFSKRNLPLVVGEIVIGEDAFVGVRALILPGVEIGSGAVIGGGAVVVKDMPEWMICAGNPCKPLKARPFDQRDSAAGAKQALQAEATTAV